MARNLTYNDMVDIIAMRTGKSKDTVKQIYDNILDIIANELKNNSYIHLRSLGEIKLEQRGGKDEIFFNQFGLQERRYVDPYYVLDLKANKMLLDYINGDTDKFVKPSIRKRKLHDNKTKDEAYSDFLDTDSNVELDDYLFNLAKRRRENTDYINAWAKGELEVDPNKIKHAKKIYCITNDVTYNSIREMAFDLQISESKLYKRIQRGKYDCDGYEFKMI